MRDAFSSSAMEFAKTTFNCRTGFSQFQSFAARLDAPRKGSCFHTRRLIVMRLVLGTMTAILEIPEVRRRVSPLTVEEYHRLDEFNEHGRRTELIRGVVIEKMAKSPLQTALSKQLCDLIAARLPSGFLVRHDAPITLADSEPEPDISVVRGTLADFVQAHPRTAELVIEVAVSSVALDRENASLYAEAGVKEYWIVLGDVESIDFEIGRRVAMLVA
ncbi:MAG: Uma2 family endonuclease [Verrucomicrobia bacterium]|nr:Uma2 family endonuclease [Verrucomicrobiota bacterium]